MRKLYQAHAILFVCAYFGFLVYCAPADVAERLALLQLSPAPHDAASSVAVSAAAQSAPLASANSGNTKASNDKALAVEAARTGTVSGEAEREEQRTRLSQIGQQAMRAAEPQERAEAIDQLHAATPETLQALQIAVTSDTAVRNRVRAVNSLRALAEQDGAQQQVLSILHLAMADANASVASRATEVYRELTQQPEPEPEPQSVAAE